MYNPTFYALRYGGSSGSARAVLSLLYDLFAPDSVLDVGCGDGAWLAVAEALGSSVLHGWDGPWVQPASLHSRTIQFRAVDMQTMFPKPPAVDLAMSLECAEHLTADRAQDMVWTLCAASRVVVFSAAIPHQGGVHHVNEQPQSYWIDLFRANGYTCFDIFRARLWSDASVDWWYRQNTFLFVHPSHPLHGQIDGTATMPADIVHPEMVECMAAKADVPYRAPDLATCVRIFARWARDRFVRK